MSIITPRIAAAALAMLLTGALDAQIVSPPTIIPPPTPARFVPGAPTWIVRPGLAHEVATGTTYTTYTGCGTVPISNAVAFALRQCGPGDVVGVYGQHPTVKFVANANPCQQGEVSWAGGAIVQDVSIVGLDSNAAIEGVTFFGDVSQPGGGGIDRVTFQDLTFYNPVGSFSPMLGLNTGRHGLLRVYGCLFDSLDPSGWGGKGMKFGMRLYLTSVDARDNVFVTGAQEHNFYLDSPGWDGAYATSLILDNNATLVPTGRTGIQVVNRIYPVDNCNFNANSYVGSPGLGTILIRNNTLHADASAGGGSTITIAGHLGPVWVSDNHVTQTGGAGGSVDTGGLVAWEPCATWTNANGYAIESLYVFDNTFVGTGSRPNAKASSCELVWVGENSFQAAGIGVGFNKPTETPNGTEYLPASTMGGWLQGGCKAMDTITGVWQCLTDAQIDNRY